MSKDKTSTGNLLDAMLKLKFKGYFKECTCKNENNKNKMTKTRQKISKFPTKAKTQ